MNKATVVYHSADFDGIFCREIARKFLPDAELSGWNFGDPLIVLPADGRTVYVLDLSPDCLNDFQRDKIIWIDHHKTSIDKWSLEIPGYRIDGVAACRLAWQWFTAEQRLKEQCSKDPDWINTKYPFPTKQDYFDRKIVEPYAVRLAGEYDIWDKRDPEAEVFQYSLRSVEPDWKRLLNGDLDYTTGLLDKGRSVQFYAQATDASICESRTWLMKWEGLNFLCLNSARFNSLVFTAKDVPETGHDALLVFCFNGKQWTVSLYHAKHRTDLDLSVIAKQHGGGGHRGACGFTCKTLPFSL